MDRGSERHTRSKSPSKARHRRQREQSPSSPERERRRNKRHEERGKASAVPEISQDDYFRLNASFRLWLRKEKNKYFDELPTAKARKHFASFVRAWNSGRLRSRYYSQDGELANLSKSIVTRHNWSFAANINREEMDHIKAAVQSSSALGAAAEVYAPSQEQGPTIPSRAELPPESARLFDEEQRDRDRWRRRKERRDAKERRELILDEVAPKETGREAMLAKKRALNQIRHAERTVDMELSDSEVFGGATDDLDALKKDRAVREKRRLERKQEIQSEKSHGQRLQERMDKERSTIELLQAMAQQSREQGLGMLAHHQQHQQHPSQR